VTHGVSDVNDIDGSGIWFAAGAILISAVIHGIDTLILKINPIVMGAGNPLFIHAPYSLQHFEPLNSELLIGSADR